MVEINEISDIMKLLSDFSVKITGKDLKKNLRRIERDTSFNSLSDDQKIEKILSRADDEILEAQEKLERGRRKKKILYSEWKDFMLGKFVKKLSIREFLRSYQRKEESSRDYFTRIRKTGEELFENDELILEVAYLGLRQDVENIEKATMQYKAITDDLLDVVERLDGIRKDAWQRKINREKRETGQKYKDKKKFDKDNQVNDIEDISDVIKEDYIYFFNQKFKCIMDTGSRYNFITYKIGAKLNLSFKKLTEPLNLMTCLLERFTVYDYVNLKFKIGNRWYKDDFLVMPKRDDESVIIGKEWMKKGKCLGDAININMTLKEAVDWLCQEKDGLKDVECEIKTEPGKIVVNPIYNVAQAYEEGVEKSLNRLLKKGYVSESKSTWLNNVKPVFKDDGSIRLTTNLIKLNQIVEQDGYTIPRMEELIYRVGDAEIFTKIDLLEGFFQVPLKKEDRMKTAFRYKNRTYEWNRMPMGFKNASSVFQRAMDKILEGEIGKCCFVYIDDILVFSKTPEEHEKDVIRICSKLSRAGLTANKNKLEVAKKSVEFLGHMVSKEKIEAIVDHKSAVKDFPKPQNKTQVKRFIGMVSYQRKYIKDCSTKAYPLIKLLKKKQRFEWTQEQEDAFQNLKNELVSENCLFQPDWKNTFILTTDASNVGLGAVLSQKKGDKEYAIAYASRTLVDAEFNYSITEKEMLAALWAMEHFRYFLLGRKFTLITDHRALEALTKKGFINSARIQRWMERIEVFDFEVIYRKPQELEHVDALSRCAEGINSIGDEDIDNLIIKVHEELVHRGQKATYERLTEKYSDKKVTMEKVKEVLSRCVRCKQYNPIRVEGFRFIEAFEPGEKVAFDLIGPLEGKYVATAIDYFSRFAIAKVLDSKASDGMVRFLEIVQRKLQAKTMISDGAKENISDNVGVFMDKHEIKHHITSAYHHCSNGRIERFNRTLGEALKKQDPELRLSKRVDEAIKAYNQTIHSAIGLKPEEALNPEILDDVKKRQFDNRVERYKKLFNAKEQKKLELNDLVLIENSVHKFKGQPKFLEMGEVVGILSNDTYWVSRRNKCTKCHITQLRKISEDDFFL